VLPLSPRKLDVSGLSEVERSLISIRPRIIDALRSASGGALDFEPSEDGWIRLREPMEKASQATSLKTDQGADPQTDREVAALDSLATLRIHDTIQKVPASTLVSLRNLPWNVAGEPQDIEDRRRFRKAAIMEYKCRRRHLKGSPITDLDIAGEAGWSDRTPISRFKSCDLRNTPADNDRIWRVLRPKHSPPFSTCAPKKYPQSSK
jgi:hypothetical protein